MSWASEALSNERLVRALVTINVFLANVYFKLREAKANRVVARRVSGEVGPAAAQHQQQRTKQPPAADEQSSMETRGNWPPARIVLWRRKTRSLTTPSVNHQHQATSRSSHKPPPPAPPPQHHIHHQGASPHNGFVEVSAKSGLPLGVDSFARRWYRLSEYYYWYLLIKNLLLCLIRHDALAPWRFLDCYLLGRFVINGRTIQLTPYCACYVAIIRLIWMQTVMRAARTSSSSRQGGDFRMPVLEFLLDKRGHLPFWLSAAAESTGQPPSHHSLLLEYQNPFQNSAAAMVPPSGERQSDRSGNPPQAEPPPLFRLRPNRTRAAWDRLARTTVLYYASVVVLFTCLGTFFALMGMPVVFTRRGFEYNYRHCSQWLAAETRDSSRAAPPGGGGGGAASNWLYNSFLPSAATTTNASVSSTSHAQTAAYVKPKVIPEVYLAWDRTTFVSFSAFHLVRSVLEIFETASLYLEIGLLLNAACFMAVIFSHDILAYARAINERLERHIEARKAHANHLLRHGSMATKFEILAPTAALQNLCADTADIQAQVADMLIMIDSYNKYMSLQSQCLLIYWFGYSILVSSWIFVPGNESPKSEWYVIHAGATLYVFYLLVHMSAVKTRCRRTYRLCSLAMGHDADDGPRQSNKISRNIWLSLLQFYKPRPLYCFTMIGSIEITHLLGLKLLVWMLSALIVASSFFQVYNIN